MTCKERIINCLPCICGHHIYVTMMVECSAPVFTWESFRKHLWLFRVQAKMVWELTGFGKSCCGWGTDVNAV